MKFKINDGAFIRGLKSSVEVATKNVNKEYLNSYHLTLDVKKDKIISIAHGGTCSITAILSSDHIDNLNYSCEEEGQSTVVATDLINSLYSFPPSEDINIELNSGEVIISSGIEKDVYQTLPTIKQKIDFPTLAKTFEKEIKINREVFIEGLDAVHFAVGFAETQPHYMCIYVEAMKNKVRFCAGTGARFSVSDVDGKNIIEVNEKTKFLIPQTNISNIINILKEDSSTDIYIKQAKQSKDNPEQIVILSNEMTLILLGIDSGLKYVDIDKILGHTYPYKIETEISNWKYNITGVRATFNANVKSENIIHCADVLMDFKKNQMVMETKGQMKSKRKIPFTIVSKNGDDEIPSFKCNSVYLREITDKSEKTDKVTLEFTMEEKPVLIRFADRTNDARSTTDKFSIFFVKTK